MDSGLDREVSDAVTQIVAEYEKLYNVPVLRGSAGTEDDGTDDWGDIACPFCDKIICNEGQVLRIGDKCWNCHAEVVRFKK